MPAGVITAVMLVTAFGHGRDANVKLENTSVTGSENLLRKKTASIKNGRATFYHLWRRSYYLFVILLCKKCPIASLVSLPEIQIKGIHIHWEVGVCTRDGISVCNL